MSDPMAGRRDVLNDADEYIYSNETDRCAVIRPFGIACYQLTHAGPKYRTGHHVGVVGTCEEAEAWIAGDDSVKLMRVWNDDGTVGL